MNIISLNATNSIINNIVMELRNVNIQGDRMRFASNIETIGMLLAYEASKYLDFHNFEFHTPYHYCQTQIITNLPVLYTILRAGIGLQQGVQRVFHDSKCAYFAAKHIHSDYPELKYIDAPQINDQVLILSDPIIATGKTIAFAINSIKKFGVPSKIMILSVISTTLSIDFLSKTLPDDTVFITCQIDGFIPGIRGTNPGVGDIGDLMYGKKIKIEY